MFWAVHKLRSSIFNSQHVKRKVQDTSKNNFSRTLQLGPVLWIWRLSLFLRTCLFYIYSDRSSQIKAIKSIPIDTAIWGPHVILYIFSPSPLLWLTELRTACWGRGATVHWQLGYTRCEGSSSSLSSRRCALVLFLNLIEEMRVSHQRGYRAARHWGRGHRLWIHRCRGRRGRCVEGHPGGKVCRMGGSLTRRVPAQGGGQAGPRWARRGCRVGGEFDGEGW